jgi:hypothetical protein
MPIPNGGSTAVPHMVKPSPVGRRAALSPVGLRLQRQRPFPGTVVTRRPEVRAMWTVLAAVVAGVLLGLAVVICRFRDKAAVEQLWTLVEQQTRAAVPTAAWDRPDGRNAPA